MFGGYATAPHTRIYFPNTPLIGRPIKFAERTIRQECTRVACVDRAMTRVRRVMNLLRRSVVKTGNNVFQLEVGHFSLEKKWKV